MQQQGNKSKLLFIATLLLSLMGISTIGCDSSVYDRLKDCPQNVVVKFYSKTPCDQDSSYLGRVSQLHLFAFDENGILIKAISQTDILLDKDYQIKLTLDKGYYSFIGWTGLNDLVILNQIKEGSTRKADLLFALKTQSSKAPMIGTHSIYQGESTPIRVDDASEIGSQTKYAFVNLTEITNRINVTVELHESTLKAFQPSDYQIEVYSANGKMTYEGDIPPNNPQLEYPSTITQGKNYIKASYSMLALKSGRSNLLILKNKKNNQIVWKGDLMGSLLMKNYNIDFDCQHDFDVKFLIKDKCQDCGTYVCWAIYIDGWQIHSYEVELDNQP